MDVTTIAAIATELKSAEIANNYSVKVVKGCNEQAEAVANIIFQSIAELDPDIGKNLDIVA